MSTPKRSQKGGKLTQGSHDSRIDPMLRDADKISDGMKRSVGASS